MKLIDYILQKPEETALYLGSVRFFKHLIVSAVVIVILGLGTAVVVLAVGNNEKKAEIEQLGQIIDALGIESNEPVNTMSNGADYEPDDNIPGQIEPPSVPEPEPAIKSEPASDDSPYAELFPHLYSDYVPPASYMDDTGYIYLTFDDGPSVYTADILRYLDKHGVHATFFVMPDDNERGKDFLNTMLNNGHEIGIHCMRHEYSIIYKSVEAYLEDFNEAWNLVYEQTGYKPYLYRFPGGSINDYNKNVRADIIAEMTRRGFVYYDWNSDSRDALDATWTEMYNTVLNEVANVPRAVVLFHDRPGGYNTVTVIEDIIKALLADPAEYKFSTITRETRPMQF
ncbi:MAG: polysaccharide deacetylase [Oscillospiraceae bacterium]|nr:polysaccharide deacetylase [Oscillospiraceae bacterium]